MRCYFGRKYSEGSGGKKLKGVLAEEKDDLNMRVVIPYKNNVEQNTIESILC